MAGLDDRSGVVECGARAARRRDRVRVLETGAGWGRWRIGRRHRSQRGSGPVKRVLHSNGLVDQR